MVKRVFAAAAAGAVALLLVAAGAGAQTYPPPANSITVDDPTPAQGQTIAVTLTTCRPGTFALIGIDVFLFATPTVGADGAARASVVVPSWAPPGEHWVSGACLGPNWQPLFLSTRIVVERATSAPDGGGNQVGGPGTATGGPSAGSGGAGAGAGRGAGAGAGRPAMPSLDALAAPVAPPDAALLYEMAALNGGPAVGADADAGRGASRQDAGTDAEGDGGPGTLGTIARVAFGVLALGGVPVAMAFSRGRAPAVFGGRFAAQ
jgi:hypothetical protein